MFIGREKELALLQQDYIGNVTTRTKDRTKLVSYIECDTNKSPRQHVK